MNLASIHISDYVAEQRRKIPTVDAVPLSELIELRDRLNEGCLSRGGGCAISTCLLPNMREGKPMRMIDADELNKFPIRLDHYDKEHGSEVFVLGIESVLEYAEYLPTIAAVPVSELLSLRDNLYEDNLITRRGLRDLNMLIAKYEGGRKDGNNGTA